MRSEAYDMLMEMRTVRTDTKDFISKAMKFSVDGDTLRNMSKESFSMMQDTFKLFDEIFQCMDKSIDCIDRLIQDQSEANAKIEKIYQMLSKTE